MLIEKILNRAKKNKNNFLIKNLSGEKICCFILKDETEIFYSCCMFFNVDKNLILNLKSNCEASDEK